MALPPTHQEGHRTYVSFSAPLVLFLRCFCSVLAGGVWPIAGGFRFANIFRCLSISSRWEFILSCCLKSREEKKNTTQVTKSVHLVVFGICSYQTGAMNFKSLVLVRFVTKYFCTEKGDVPNMSQSFKDIFYVKRDPFPGSQKFFSK